MKKIIFTGIVLYTQLNAVSLDLCAKEPVICSNINNNIANIGSSDKRNRLKSITQLSRMVGSLPSPRDNKKLEDILSKVKQYPSVFGGKFFELLAKKNCNGRIYFVEAKFDNSYNVHFKEKEPNQIVIDRNSIIFDNEQYAIPQSSINKYKSSLDKIFVRPRVKQQSTSSTTLVENFNQICLTGKINLRNANKPYEPIGKIDERFFIEDIGNKKKIKVWDSKKGKYITISAILVNAQSPDRQVNLTGYITANPKFQRRCN